ncbi:MAG: hypothetical protein K2N73_08590 [Lachnospiraceae bacterium]|nr:hypothetical protein [Lachnospiraceae bacterium]
MKRLICMAALFTVFLTITACGNSQNGKNTDLQAENGMSLSVHPNTETEESIQSETFDSGTMEYDTFENGVNEEENVEMKMNVRIGGINFTATLENNDATDVFVEMMETEPVVIQMSDYSGFEKVGSLGRSLPTNNSQITTKAGDIVLYQGNQIVIFYGSNSWSYTRLGRIDDLTGWEDALGSKDVIVTFSLED